jgi:hypothetical protein
MYRLGDSNALTMLNAGLNKGYALATLLQRVFNAGWPASAFASMAQELHYKVVEELTRTQELPVNEANR